MFQVLFYKEWSKTKRIILLIVLVFAGVVGYVFINTEQMFRVNGSVQTWVTIITKDMSILPAFVQWLPILASLLLAFLQFVPETTDKRLKLTLHLPMTETKVISIMLFYGICVLVVLYMLTYIIMLIGLSLYYPSEIIRGMLWQSSPWFLAGLIGYLFVAWICLEPIWRQRIFNAFAAICALSFFFIGARSGAYMPFMPYLIIITIVVFSYPFYSTARFKEGAQ